MIRGMTASDLSGVLLIEQAVQCSPWSKSLFQNSLAAGDLSLVVEEDGVLQAYLLLKPILDEAELLTIAVGQQYQRQGLARQLLLRVIKQFNKLFLEVRPSNLAAISLYEQLGFAVTGRRTHYYGDEDALLMARVN